MAGVGQAAARGEDPGRETLAALQALAAADPLASEPFLIQGAMALRSGDLRRAERLLSEARQRTPRAPAARYLLADLYLRTGRPLPALVEMSVLNRLLPQASLQLPPALAAYAKTPGAAGQLGAIVRAYPELKPALLDQLSADAANAELVLSLAGKDPDGPWRGKLVQALLDAGNHAKARRVWEQLSGAKVPAAGLFNPGFEASEAPPPFNWQLANDGGGVADGGSRALDVLYYGRSDMVLAAQTLLLPPGTYRLGMRVRGDVGEPGSVRWIVRCLGGGEPLLELPLPAEAGAFQVPADCKVQRLELVAVGQEFPKQAQFSVGGLQLTRVGGS